jgi:hypothetical protein
VGLVEHSPRASLREGFFSWAKGLRLEIGEKAEGEATQRGRLGRGLSTLSVTVINSTQSSISKELYYPVRAVRELWICAETRSKASPFVTKTGGRRLPPALRLWRVSFALRPPMEIA